MNLPKVKIFKIATFFLSKKCVASYLKQRAHHTRVSSRLFQTGKSSPHFYSRNLSKQHSIFLETSRCVGSFLDHSVFPLGSALAFVVTQSIEKIRAVFEINAIQITKH